MARQSFQASSSDFRLGSLSYISASSLMSLPNSELDVSNREKKPSMSSVAETVEER